MHQVLSREELKKQLITGALSETQIVEWYGEEVLEHTKYQIQLDHHAENHYV